VKKPKRGPPRQARGERQRGALKEAEGLDRHFEGRAQLAKLLEKAGSSVAPDEVAEGFARAQEDKLEPRDVMPALFDGEPRFEKPADARALYSNLLGLWDLVASGAKLDLAAPPPREKVPRPQPIDAPPMFETVPDVAWVEAAWRSLESQREGELTRLWHSFDNKQDALAQWLEVEASKLPLSDAAFGATRDACFELFALLQRSGPRGWPKVKPEQLAGAPTETVPPALAAFADESCFDLETDEVLALPANQSAEVRRLVTRVLQALWAARD
jgi:hypothetical protein